MSNTTGGRNSNALITRIVFTGVMAAIICVITTFRIPLGQSKVHFANSMCLLSGLLLGPVWGGTAAGLGSALYDLSFYNEGIINLLITFVSKFAMAWICGKLYNGAGEKKVDSLRLVLACVAGALCYVALYMLKSGIYGAIAGNFWAPVISKFPASVINAAVAIAAAPIFYHAVRPSLMSSGILTQLRYVR